MKEIFVGYLLVIGFIVVSWLVNLGQFLNCDFEPVNKEEIVKGIGVFIPPAAVVTVLIN